MRPGLGISSMLLVVTLPSHGKGLMRKFQLFLVTFSAFHGLLTDWFLVIDCINGICRGGIVSHSFELEAKEKLLFNGAPALITFRIPTKAALQVRCLQPVPLLLIVAV